MAINKVVYGNDTLIDLTDTTATASDVASGKSFYGANGVKMTGSGDYIEDVQIDSTSIVSNKVATIPHASTSNYGVTKLSTSTSSTSTNLAATPSAVKSAYDLANSKQDVITSSNKLDYSLIDNTPEIPTKTSDLTNDSNFPSDSNYVHTDNNFTTTLKNKLNGIASGAEVNAIDTIKVNGTTQTITSKAVDISVPTNNNQLTNGAGYQTSSQVQTAIDNALADITGIDFEIVQTLPSTGTKGVIYLVPNSGSGQNIYDEYIYVNNAFEKIGTTEVDLTNYIQFKSWDTTNNVYTVKHSSSLASLLSIDASTHKVHIGNLPTTNSLTNDTSTVPQTAAVYNALNGKQNAITNSNKLDYALLSNTPTIPTVNNGTLTIQKNGSNVSTFTANQSGNSTANITVPTKTSELTNNSNFLVNSGSYLNIHPENTPVLIPFIHNDIAFLLKRGGSAKVLYDNVEQTLDISNVFDGSGSYWAINPTGTTTIVIELTLHKVFTWTNTIYCDFGAAGWRSKSVNIEVMNTNYTGDTWSSKYSTTTNGSGNVKTSFAHTPVGASNAGGGFNKIRFTFSGWNTATIFRISQLGVYNYGSQGVRETYMSRGIDDAIYRNITPNSNNTFNLGSSSNKWNTVYATTFNGNATSATKATGDKNGNDITTTYYKASNPNGYTNNTGTITGITMNNVSKGTSGVVDLGTVITDVSGKQDKITSSNKLDYSLLSNTPTIPTLSDSVDSSSSTTAASSKAVKTVNDQVIYDAARIDEMEAANVYSTTERKTNEFWIDEKPIYRKVIYVGNLPNNTAKRVASNITNISYVTRIYGVASTGAYVIPLPDTYPNASVYDVRLSFDLSTREVVVLTATDRTSYVAYVIIEYTKTTD